MGETFLQSVENFLQSFQTSLLQIQAKSRDDNSTLVSLLESGELFEFSENLEAFFLHFWSLVPGYERDKMEKRLAKQLCNPEMLTAPNVAETVLCSIRNVVGIPITQDSIQKTNAVLLMYECAFLIMELMARFESKLNPNAFLDRLKIQPDRDPSLELTRLGRYLLNHVLLVAKGRPYRLTEVEAYLQSEQHPDPFVHGAPEQSKHCRFYFHKRGSSYLEGPRKGMDLTFGTEGLHQGGFLIRGIGAQDEAGHYVDGPSRCVDEILKTLGQKSASELGERFQATFTKELSPDFYLLSTPSLHFGEWCAAPRVGLALRKSDLEERVKYIDRLYRFHICPDQTKSDSKLIFLALLRQGWSGGHARLLMNMKEFQCKRALEAFQEGKGKDPKTFVDAARSNESDRCELYGALASPESHRVLATADLTVDESEHPHFSEFDEAG